MASGSVVVGIDLGGTNMQIGVVDAANRVLGRVKLKTKADKGGDAVVERMAQGVRDAVEQAGVTLADVAGMGVGCPGAIDLAKGIVIEAPNLRWNMMPLAENLSASLAGRPVLLDNDVNVAVVGENRLGAGNNARDVLGVWIGTGIGGGLILNGGLYYGGFESAGEIGHVTLFPGAALGNRSLEQNCSRKFIVERILRLVRANHTSILPELAGDSSDIGAGLVAEAYQRGDDLTRRVVDEAADLLAIAIANAVTLLSLPLVLLGGGLTEAMGPPFADRVQSEVRKHVFPRLLQKVRVVPTRLEDEAGLLGAALLARDRFGQRA